MLKLKDILLEDDKPFGNILFGDPNNPEELRDLQNANEPEPDTSLEHAFYIALTRWYKESFVGFASYAKKLLSMKSEYPTILDPMKAEDIPKKIYRAGKLGIHINEVLTHLNNNADKLDIKLVHSDVLHKSYRVSVTAPYTYKIEGKEVTSWGVDNPQVLRRVFAYGNQVLYGANAKENSSNLVMNPVASTAISATTGNVNDESEVIFIGTEIEVDYVEVPLFISDSIQGYLAFGDINNLGTEYNSINAIVDDRYDKLAAVLTKRIHTDGFWKKWSLKSVRTDTKGFLSKIASKLSMAA